MASPADVAEKAVAARKAGKHVLSVGYVTFDLETPGMCSRFARQCTEGAHGLHDFESRLFGATAIQTEAILKAAGKAVATPVRGDLVCLNRSSGKNGHIAVWLGGGLVAENTISGSRGDPRAPGTKITPLSAIGAQRVTGYYRPFSLVDESVPADEFTADLAWANAQGIVHDTDGQSEVRLSRLCAILNRLYAKITSGV